MSAVRRLAAGAHPIKRCAAGAGAGGAAARCSRQDAPAARPGIPDHAGGGCRPSRVALRAPQAWPHPNPVPWRRRDQVPEAQRGRLPAAEGAGLPGRRGRQPQAALRRNRGRLQGVVQDRRHRVAHQQGRQDHPRVRAGRALRRAAACARAGRRCAARCRAPAGAHEPPCRACHAPAGPCMGGPLRALAATPHGCMRPSAACCQPPPGHRVLSIITSLTAVGAPRSNAVDGVQKLHSSLINANPTMLRAPAAA